ncbi:unnamed protein product, partial [Amoebophrya sp. A120]
FCSPPLLFAAAPCAERPQAREARKRSCGLAQRKQAAGLPYVSLCAGPRCCGPIGKQYCPGPTALRSGGSRSMAGIYYGYIIRSGRNEQVGCLSYFSLPTTNIPDPFLPLDIVVSYRLFVSHTHGSSPGYFRQSHSTA